MKNDMIKIEGWKNISRGEYFELQGKERLYIMNTEIPKNTSYYKKVQEFPIVFKNWGYIIKVDKNKIEIEDSQKDYMCFNCGESLPLLIEAVDKFREINK